MPDHPISPSPYLCVRVFIPQSEIRNWFFYPYTPIPYSKVFFPASDDDLRNPKGGLGIGNWNALTILSAGPDSKT